MSCPIALGQDSYSLANSVWQWSLVTETPPSHTNLTWYVNPCAELETEHCPKGSIVCGVQTVEVGGQHIVTEVIPVAQTGTDRQVRALDAENEGVRLSWSGEKWGDIAVNADVSFICGQEERTSFADWSGSALKLELESPKACLKSAEPEQPSSGGWGFFSVFFFLLCVAFFAFVGIAVAQNRRINDVGALGELISELPFLLRELWTKLVGAVSGSRGGYSAV